MLPEAGLPFRLYNSTSSPHYGSPPIDINPLRISAYYPVRDHAKIQEISRSERDDIACSTGYCGYDGRAYLENVQKSCGFHRNLANIIHCRNRILSYQAA
jgi:hypothetical protein